MLPIIPHVPISPMCDYTVPTISAQVVTVVSGVSVSGLCMLMHL